MKKFIVFALILVSAFALSSCKDSNKYEDEAGVYSLYYMTGDLNLSMYEYYTIELFANGDVTVKSKPAGSSQLYEASATFSIEDGKITIVSVNGSTKVTEIYDYIDGEIHMLNVEEVGISFTAKFRRAETE